MSFQMRRKTVEAFRFMPTAWPDWFCKCVMTGRITIVANSDDIFEAKWRLVLAPDVSHEFNVGDWIVWEADGLTGYTDKQFHEMFEPIPERSERGL